MTDERLDVRPIMLPEVGIISEVTSEVRVEVDLLFTAVLSPSLFPTLLRVEDAESVVGLCGDEVFSVLVTEIPV